MGRVVVALRPASRGNANIRQRHQCLRGSNEPIHVAVRQLWRRQNCKALPVKHGAAVPFEIRRNEEWRQTLGVGFGARRHEPDHPFDETVSKSVRAQEVAADVGLDELPVSAFSGLL